MWYPCWLPQQIEYARLLLGGIVVPVAVDIPVYAGWCISVFLHAAGWRRDPPASTAYHLALACETPRYLHSEIDRQLAVGTVEILLPTDKNVMAVRTKAFMGAHKVPNFV